MSKVATEANQVISVFSFIRRRVQVQLMHYGVAVFVVLAALIAMLLLDPWLNMKYSPFLLFSGAITISAWYGGFKPGLLATVLSALAGNYFFVEPLYTISLLPAAAIRVGLYIIQGILISLVCEALRAEKYRTEKSLRREKAARAAAETMQQRLSFLDRASTLLATSLDYETTLQSIVDLTVPAFADLASIDILQTDRSINPMVVVKAKESDKAALSRQITQQYPLNLKNQGQPITRVFHTGRSELLQEVTDTDYIAIAQGDAEHLRLCRQLGVRSAIYVPLIAHSVVFGVLSLMLIQTEQRYREDDLRLAEELGRRMGLAIENARLHQKLQRAVQRKEESLALLNTWLASSPVGLAFLDTDLRYVYANEALANLNGIPLSQHLGQTLSAVLPDWAPHLEPIFQQVMQTNTPLLNQEISGETHPPSLHRHALASYYPVGLVDGQVIGVGVTIIDITNLKQTEQALRESESRCRSVVDCNMIGIGFWEADGTVTAANDALLQMIGYTQAELEAGEVNWQALTPVEYAAREAAALVEARDQGYCTPYEKEYIRKDGSRFPILIGGGRFEDDPNRGAFFVLDISDRKCGEAEIYTLNQRLEQRINELQTLLNVIPIGIAIAEDPECHLIRANPFFQKLFNITPDTNLSVTGAGTAKVPVRRLRNGQEIPDGDLPMQVACSQGIEVRNAEVQIVRSDGAEFDLLGSATPLFDDEQRIRGCVAVFMDITDNKRFQKELQEQKERLRLAVEGADLGMWDYDLRTGLLLWSTRCKTMHGIAPDAPMSYDLFLQAIHPDDRERVDQAVQQAIDHRTDYDTEMRSVWADGTVRWIRSIGRAYYDKQNNPIRMAGVALDVTSRKHIEAERDHLLHQEQAARAEAEQANRIKDEFLAVLSHELRSPLNPILGWAKLLRSRSFDDTTRDRALETIERNAKLQAQLIEDLLDVSRILRGKLALNITSVDLAAIIRAAIETVQLAADTKSIQIQTILSPGLGHILGDAGRLQQVVWNLLSNAVKFTPAGGQIEVGLSAVLDQALEPMTDDQEPVTHYAQITVKDTGKGIAPDFLPHVFDYFRQADSSTTRKFGGLGLGLAIVRQLVELHGGMVQVASSGEGQGSTFTVLLPLASSVKNPIDPSNSSPAACPLSPELLLQGVHILVVDDEVDMRDYITFVLQQAGAKVSIAASAQEALNLLFQSPLQSQPDVLISDIGMPSIDGYMLIQQVRATEQAHTIPAIALTAYAGEYDQKRALAAGFQFHIAKPVEPDQLLKAITTLVRQPRLVV